MKKYLLIIFSVSISFYVHGNEKVQSACLQFQKKMNASPNLKVTYKENVKVSSPEEVIYNGCSVVSETKRSLVPENFPEFSFFKLPKWNYGGYIADGPGSSQFEVVKDKLFCMVGYDFMAYHNEKTKQIVTGDELKVFVECAERK